MNKKMLVLLIMMLFIPFVVDAYEVKKVWENDTIMFYYLISEDGEIISFYNESINKHDKDGNILWQNDWGGSGYDWIHSGTLTKDGGFIIVGESNSTDIAGLTHKGGLDGIIVKYDKDGNLLWQKNWGGTGNDLLSSISLTVDGGFVVGGQSNSTDIVGHTNISGYNAIIIKFDKNGNVLWQKNWSDSANGGDEFSSMFSTNSGDIFAADDHYNPTIIVKYDKDGNMLWQKNLGDEGMSEKWDLTNDEDIIAFSNPEYKMVKYDKGLNVLWEKDWPEDDYFSKFILKNGDIFAVADKYDRVSKQTNAKIVKFDKQGNIIWEKVFDIGEFDDVTSVSFIANDEFIVHGIIISNNTMYNKNIKYSIKFDLEMANMENGTASVEQQGRYGIIKPTPNEGYVVDKIIVKDTAGNNIEVTKLEDGTYSFELYDDVTVDVLFKETLVNPKTGVSSMIGVIFTILLIAISGFFIIRNYENRYEF